MMNTDSRNYLTVVIIRNKRFVPNKCSARNGRMKKQRTSKMCFLEEFTIYCPYLVNAVLIW